VAEELDLRDYFGAGGPVASELRRYDIGWLRGGNVFVLRYAPARSGADAELTRVLGAARRHDGMNWRDDNVLLDGLKGTEWTTATQLGAG
jgi:hypothetical protein